MNVLAIYVANDMLQAERRKATERAIAHALPAGPSLRDRIASATTGLRRLVGTPAAGAGVLPRLGDNPYRG